MSVLTDLEMFGGKTNPLQNHVARNLKDYGCHEHELVSQIDRVPIHTNVLVEASGEGAGEAHAIELESKQTEKQQGQDGKVNPWVKSIYSLQFSGRASAYFLRTVASSTALQSLSGCDADVEPSAGIVRSS